MQKLPAKRDREITKNQGIDVAFLWRLIIFLLREDITSEYTRFVLSKISGMVIRIRMLDLQSEGLS
jgi:hypothetical protein